MKQDYLDNKELEALIKRYQKSQQDKVRYQLIIDDVESSIAKRAKHKKAPAHDVRVYHMEFQRAKSEFTDAQGELANKFYLLAQRLIRYAKDIIVDTDDSEQEAVMICFEKVGRFDPNYRGKNGQKAKAFNYLTTCILNHYRQIWRTHKNYKLLKERYRDFQASRFNTPFIKNGREMYQESNQYD
jgi:hypothetical protein